VCKGDKKDILATFCLGSNWRVLITAKPCMKSMQSIVWNPSQDGMESTQGVGWNQAAEGYIYGDAMPSLRLG